VLIPVYAVVGLHTHTHHAVLHMVHPGSTTVTVHPRWTTCSRPLRVLVPRHADPTCGYYVLHVTFSSRFTHRTTCTFTPHRKFHTAPTTFVPRHCGSRGSDTPHTHHHTFITWVQLDFYDYLRLFTDSHIVRDVPGYSPAHSHTPRTVLWLRMMVTYHHILPHVPTTFTVRWSLTYTVPT